MAAFGKTGHSATNLDRLRFSLKPAFAMTV
jgi:hypothetical protein